MSHHNFFPMAITLVLAVAALGDDPYANEAPLGPEAGCMMHSMAYKSVLRRSTCLFSFPPATPANGAHAKL